MYSVEMKHNFDPAAGPSVSVFCVWMNGQYVPLNREGYLQFQYGRERFERVYRAVQHVARKIYP